MERIETVIIGAGQAGLATSYWLTRMGHEHLILERESFAAPVWRTRRWDAFTMLTPNWALRMPGAEYDGPDPDGFQTRAGIVDFFAGYADRFGLPIRYDTPVKSVEPWGFHRYRVQTSHGAIEADNVVIATGFFQQTRIPAHAAHLAPDIVQLHTAGYRNPAALPEGGVLVVGSGLSGAQIAEDLVRAGREVILATGSAGHAPRRYRGRDIAWWLDQAGAWEHPRPSLTPTRPPEAGGYSPNLHQLAQDGVRLLGRFRTADGHAMSFAPDLHENLTRADGHAAALTQMIDDYIARDGLDAPADPLPSLRDGFAQPTIDRLDLRQAGIATVIWATGYRFDYTMVKFPIFDHEGFPVQDHGATRHPGLAFVGLPWLPGPTSGTLFGVGESARQVAEHIVNAYAIR